MKIVQVQFKEPIQMPSTSKEVFSGIYDDDKGRAFDVIYDRPAHAIVVVNKKTNESRCVPIGNVRFFQLTAEGTDSLLKKLANPEVKGGGK